MSGFIPIRRSLFDHFLYSEKRDFSRFEAWLDLIQMASFQDGNTTLVKGRPVTCSRGQLVASVRFLQSRWSWSASKVLSFLDLLRSQNMLLTDTEDGVNRLTLLNFEKHNRLDRNEMNEEKNSKSQSSKRIGKNHRTDNETVSERSPNADRTNIIKDKELKEEKRGVPPTPDEMMAFEKFQEWIEGHASRVAKMKEPFTIRQFLKVREKYKSEEVRQLLMDMHNWKDLDKRISAYLTLTKWKNLDDKRNLKPNESREERLQKRKQTEERTRRLADS